MTDQEATPGTTPGHERTDDAREPAPPATGPVTGPATGPELSPREVAVLAHEQRPWPSVGVKEREIRAALGLTPTRYYQLLNHLVDDPRALEHAPTLVNRLRRLREARRARR
ncbi:DUF3263 domain-containing protein [Streptomyces sp. BI20]|uniref:DUF3263 domain-containing protein n=1 Tax=Streptomyces sp. BI20 TaxID=3403460 RepID=UPI003C78DD0F